MWSLVEYEISCAYLLFDLIKTNKEDFSKNTILLSVLKVYDSFSNKRLEC